MIKKTFNSITKKEWLAVAIIICFVVLLTTSLYVYRYYKAPPDRVYTGVHLNSGVDIFVYHSYIQQVRDGKILFDDLFTSEDQPVSILNIYWLAVGSVAKFFNLSNFIVLQLFRVILIPVLVVTLYIFLSFFLKNKSYRLWGLLLMLFSSGLGKFFKFFFDGLEMNGKLNYPIDLWVTESNIFLTMFYYTAHFMASLTLIIWIFLLMYLALNNNKVKYSLIAGLLALILFQFHPFYIVSVFIILISYGLVLFFFFKKGLWMLIKHFLILGLISLPSSLYHIILVEFDPTTGLRATQNLTNTPGLAAVLVGFGLLIFFAVIGIVVFFKRYKKLGFDQRSKYVFLITWLIVNFLLLYLPISFQRRFFEGLQVPMVMLTLFSLIFIRPYLEKFLNIFSEFNKFAIIIIFASFFFMTSIDIYLNTYIYRPSDEEHQYFLKTKLEALNWLDSYGNKEKVVLSTPHNARFIPAYSGFPTYSGHWAETIFLEQKNLDIHWFFSVNNQDEKKKKFLNDNNIGYIFFGQEETVEDGYTPKTKDYLEKIYDNEEIEIYRVTFARPASQSEAGDKLH